MPERPLQGTLKTRDDSFAFQARRTKKTGHPNRMSCFNGAGNEARTRFRHPADRLRRSAGALPPSVFEKRASRADGGGSEFFCAEQKKQDIQVGCPVSMPCVDRKDAKPSVALEKGRGK